MFSKHVSVLSSAYCHDELTPQDSARFAEHLLSCPRCRVEFEEVKLGVRFAEELQLVSAPAAIWNGIVANLDSRPRDSRRYQFLKPLAIAATIVLLLAGGVWWSRINRTEPKSWQPRQSWQVARLEGLPRIDSKSIADSGALAVGQWLETDGTSRAKLDVSNIGQVEIDPNTRVRLLQTSPAEHRLELARGRLSARISAPPKLFFVNTPSGVAEDLGCAYTLEVDDAGNSVLHVTMGWVSLHLTDREPVVPAGAACATRRDAGPGTPYFEDASEAFRLALQKFDFGPATEQSSKASALEIVLRAARPRDVMTLWYLLARVNRDERGRVYDRMTALAAPPDGVTREGMLNLNQQMMERWQERLGLSWSGSTFKAAKLWRNAWANALGKFNGLQGKR
jgi:hypothetical protein